MNKEDIAFYYSDLVANVAKSLMKKDNERTRRMATNKAINVLYALMNDSKCVSKIAKIHQTAE